MGEIKKRRAHFAIRAQPAPRASADPRRLPSRSKIRDTSLEAFARFVPEVIGVVGNGKGAVYNDRVFLVCHQWSVHGGPAISLSLFSLRCARE